ncbi:hypothetical protein MHZ92_14220 [Sporosarcina sp. ACRSL]|uniref:hypothetical protein n=1 Tax=Sporosarcina sp. ACRSL TaxID=2918215 RepID=UPI001EF4CED5|nr:hypothetical protein [Sporosarcina sp. ACRSL]MCG7345291.1 hypothetical protein [Sporosarcina sp. ACRSL]
MNAKENRTIKAVSFSHDDEYESELYAFATDPARGKFGPYIKRLIDRDRASLSATPAQVMPMPVVPDAMVAQAPAKSNVGKTVAKAFL